MGVRSKHPPDPDAVLKLWVIRTQLRNRGQAHSRTGERLVWKTLLRMHRRGYGTLPPPIAAKDYVNP